MRFFLNLSLNRRATYTSDALGPLAHLEVEVLPPLPIFSGHDWPLPVPCLWVIICSGGTVSALNNTGLSSILYEHCERTYSPPRGHWFQLYVLVMIKILS